MSEERREEEQAQERRHEDEEDTRPLDAQDWEGTRGEQQQEERDAAQDEPDAAKSTGEMTHERGSQAEADEYQWHTGTKREHGSDDAVEFIDVVKAFGRNRVLNGLNLGLPTTRSR